MKILLIDDNRFDRALVVREIHKEFPEVSVDEVLNAVDLEAALTAADFDLVITDYQLQWTTGMHVLHSVKNKFPELPVIMFTGTGNEVIAVESMKAGLDDYVIKSAKHFVRLPFSIAQALERGRLRLAEKKSAATIARLHTHRELILDSVADGILGVDQQGRHSFANPAAQRMLGYALDELLGQESHALWHHTNKDGSPNPIDTCVVHSSIREEQPFSGKDLFWRKDGTDFLAEYTSAPIYENDRCTGAVIIFRDITEREKAQEELRRYRQIVSASEEHMAFIGSDCVFHAVNDAYLRAYNWTRDTVINRPVADLYANNRKFATMTANLNQAMQGTSVRYRDWFDFPSQSRRYMDVAYYPYKTDNGMISGVVINSRDITDLKGQEDALRLAEQEWKHTFDSISDLVSVHDANYRFLKVNKTLADFVGKPAKELIGKHCYEVFHALSYPWPECPHQRALNKGCPATIEIDDPHIGHPMLVTVSPIIDVQGRVVATVHIAKDITELKKAEQERLDLQTQLSQAQKMECIGQLVGGVVHDFNNFLSAIIGFSELILMKHPGPSELHENITQIKSAGLKSAALVQQLLAFSRKQVSEMAPVRLDSLLENLGKMLHRLLGEEIILDFDLNSGDSVIVADSVQIEQVIMNLVVNARDAMPAGGRIHIGTTSLIVGKEEAAPLPGPGEGKYVQLTVTDTGNGIKSEDRPRLFEPFFTTKGIGKGTGMGLATVYNIVSQHKGWVDFESEVGVGTVFRILLPRDSQQQNIDEQKTEMALPTGNETILLVDDEPTIRTVIRKSLNSLGYQVLEAGSVREALNIFDQHLEAIDLLITDVIMPAQRGTVLAELVKNRSQRIKVLFVSGYSDESIDPDGILQPGVNFLKKPITIKKLSEMVRHLLDID